MRAVYRCEQTRGRCCETGQDWFNGKLEHTLIVLGHISYREILSQRFYYLHHVLSVCTHVEIKILGQTPGERSDDTAGDCTVNRTSMLKIRAVNLHLIQMAWSHITWTGAVATQSHILINQTQPNNTEVLEFKTCGFFKVTRSSQFNSLESSVRYPFIGFFF